MKKLNNTKAIISAIQKNLSKDTNIRVFAQGSQSDSVSKTASRKAQANVSKDSIDMQTGFDKTAGIQKTASFEMGNVNTMFYSPRLTPDTWYLPRSRKMLLKWVDIFFDWDPYIYSILMMHSRYPIGNFNLVCDEKEEQFFNEVLHNEQWDILDVLREGSISFTKYGECVALGDWDSEHGVWKGFSWIDPGLIEVKEIPFTGKVKIFLEIPSKYVKAIKGNSKADEVERELIPDFIVEAVKKGLKYIELDNEESYDEQGRYSPPKVCMMVNKTNVGEKGLRGLPPMTPAIKCVAGDTKIALLDGSTPTVKELYDNNVQNIELYNIDENNNIVPGKAEKIIKTTIEKGLKITFDNGESITVTKDHPLMTRNGKYVQAQNLKVGDSMMPLYRKEIQFHNKAKYRKIYNPKDSKWYWEHQLLMNRENINDDNVIHHLNGKGYDNRQDNLVVMSRKEHLKWHKEHLPIQTKEQHREAVEKASAAKRTEKFKKVCKQAWNNEERRQYVSGCAKQMWENRTEEELKNIKQKISEGLLNSEYHYKFLENGKKVGSNKEYIEKRIATRWGTKREWEEIIGLENKQCSRCLNIKPKTEFCISTRNRDGFENVCKQCQHNLWENENFDTYTDTITEGYKKCFKCGWIKPETDFYDRKDTAIGKESICKECSKEKHLLAGKIKYCQEHNLDEIEAYLNHKITAIEEVGETQFYGVQNAAPYFNFAIAFKDGSGIFSKNTLVYSDYLRKAQMARAQRFAYPVEIWKFGDIANGYIPNDDELSAVREMLQKALTNPPYTIIYTPLLSLEVVSPAGGLLPIYDDYNFVENQVLVALGTNKNIVLGEGGWMSNAKTLSMQRLIMDYQIIRDMWTRTFLQNFVLRPMCIANGFIKQSLVDKTKKIANVPKIAWVNSLDVQNEEDTKKLYIDLWHDGLISSKTLYSQFPDLDFRTEVTQMQEEKGTVLDGGGRTLPATVTKLENEEKETEVKTSADEVNEKPPRPVKMDI